MRKFSQYILPFVLAAMVITGSCEGRKSRAEHNDIIPENDLISILTDVYITDGLLSLPDVNRVYSESLDSLAAYSDVIEKHGYKLDQMNRTMRFYFVSKPKKLIKLYDKVLARISEMDSRIDKTSALPGVEPGNIWSGKTSYSFPDPSGKEPAFFDFAVPFSGIYFIKFTLTLYPDDQSLSLHPGIYIYQADSTWYLSRKYFPLPGFIKDGKPHTYKSSIVVPGQWKQIYIRGWFFDNENMTSSAEHHFRVENIKLSRNPVEQ